jgi:hypothetical protein
MHPFLGSMAIVIAAATPSAPADNVSVQAAPPTATVLAAAPSPAGRSYQQAIAVQRSAEPAANEAIRRQIEFRVLTPALSGDGGG